MYHHTGLSNTFLQQQNAYSSNAVQRQLCIRCSEQAPFTGDTAACADGARRWTVATTAGALGGFQRSAVDSKVVSSDGVVAIRM